jgi:hypothetical protein
MPKVAIACLLLLTATLLALTWWREAGSDATPPTTGVVVPPAAANSQVRPEETQPASERVAVAAGAERAAAATTGDADAVRVRIIDAASSTLVSGAEVLWYDENFDWSALTAAERALHAVDSEQLLRRRCASVRTDGDGRAVIRARRTATVVARSGDRYVSGHWRADRPLPADGPFPGELVLALQQDHTLSVRAIHETGQPAAGVVVQVTTTYRGADGTEQSSIRHLDPTDGGGLTRLRHAQEALREGGNVIAVALTATITGGESQPVAVDPAALPTAPVDVVLPAFGSVVVQLQASDGSPWVAPTGSGLSVTLNHESWRGGVIKDGWNRVRCDGDGKAHFPHVCCGVRLKIGGPNGWDRETVIDGPQRALDQVLVPLRLPADGCVIAGRLLGEDGVVPSGPSEMKVQVRFEGGLGIASQPVTHDAEGRFVMPVPTQVGRTPSITFRELDLRGASRREMVVVLRGPLVSGRNELGDVVLARPPLLVAGKVVGPADASFVLAVERRTKGVREWIQAREFRVVVDPQQGFEVRGIAGDYQYRLVVTGAVAPRPPIEFVPGTDDLRVEVTAGGSLAATFLPDPLLPRLSYWLLPPPAAAGEQEPAPRFPLPGHPDEEQERLRVQWHGLAGGRHRLQVGCLGLPPLLDLEVDVPAGAAAEDPRLRDIDLRGRMRAIVVRLTDAAGQPFAREAKVVVRGEADPQLSWHGVRFVDATGDVLVVDRPVDLWVVADGQLAVVVPGVFGDQTVVLQPAPRITLRWVGAPALPADIFAQLVWSAPDLAANVGLKISSRGNGRSGNLAGMLGVDRAPRRLFQGAATMPFDAPFAMEARLVLRKANRTSKALSPAVRLDPAQLRDGQVVELQHDPAALQAALELLAGK